MSSPPLRFSAEFAPRTMVRGQPELDLPSVSLRPEMVARGRVLAIDPGYPSAKVILVVGKRLVKLIR